MLHDGADGRLRNDDNDGGDNGNFALVNEAHSISILVDFAA
jgi:hypothetical protein